MKSRDDGKCCGNCIQTDDPDFGGACCYAGEISCNFYCEHWEPNAGLQRGEEYNKLHKKGTYNAFLEDYVR